MNKSIVCTYPDFRELPKGLKQLLVVSETLFFEELHSAPSLDYDHEVKSWTPVWKPFAMNGKAAFAGV